MATAVTLHIYSGRPNPTWILDEAQENQLTERVQALSSYTNERPTGIVGGLGYRGFSIAPLSESAVAPRGLFVHEGIVDQGAAAGNLVDQNELEAWLASTATGQIDDELRAYVDAALKSKNGPRFEVNAQEQVACPRNATKDAPPYNPGIWNTPSVQPFNNCYNYANNNATNTFAQPGRASVGQATVMACSHVSPASIGDGLRVVPNFTGAVAAGAGWYVALVVWPNRDYHWYRQDDVGCWSHKPGSTAARNVDNAGKTISDPKTCDRGPYSNFCDYMVTHRGVRIK